MRNFGSNSEYKRIQSVLLHKPTLEVSQINVPKKVLYKDYINYSKISDEYDLLIETYKQHNIKIFLVHSQALNEDQNYLYNLMYTKDLLFMTLQGAILGRMFHPVRTHEIKYAQRSLEHLGVPILGAIQNSATFEGADALWMNGNTCLIGVGHRTNEEGFKQMSCLLKKQEVTCYKVPVPKGIQHLLGVVQFVDRNCVIIRGELVDSQIKDLLLKYNFQIITMPENEEITQRQAMNVVTIFPGNIFMPTNCPVTKNIFQSNGINIAAEIQIDQLINGDGGLACATSILSRGM